MYNSMLVSDLQQWFDIWIYYDIIPTISVVTTYTSVIKVLTIFLMSCITSLWLIYFITVPLIPLYLFRPIPKLPLLWWLPVSSPYLWVCFVFTFVLFFSLPIKVKHGNLCFFVWLISLSIIPYMHPYNHKRKW